MKIEAQRLRNLTTGKLHTNMLDFYEDIRAILGTNGSQPNIMLPFYLIQVGRFLREHVTDQRFWNGEYDPTHAGQIDLPTLDSEAEYAQ